MADRSTPDHDTELDRQRLAAMRMLLRVGPVGTVISASLAEGVKSEELVKNDNVAVMTDLWVAESRRPAEIQLLTGLTSGGVTKLLDRMEELGVIQRSFGKVPGDRRAIVITLTPHGEDVACSMADGILEHLGALRSALATVITLIDAAEGTIAAAATGAGKGA